MVSPHANYMRLDRFHYSHYNIYIEVILMDYQPLYCKLFNAYTDVLEALNAQNYGQAKDLLIAAQQEAEELYLNMEKDAE